MSYIARKINRARVAYSRFVMPKVMGVCKFVGEVAEAVSEKTDNKFVEAACSGFAEGIQQQVPIELIKNSGLVKLIEKHEESIFADWLAAYDLVVTFPEVLKLAESGKSPDEALVVWYEAAFHYPEAYVDVENMTEKEAYDYVRESFEKRGMSEEEASTLVESILEEALNAAKKTRVEQP